MHEAKFLNQITHPDNGRLRNNDDFAIMFMEEAKRKKRSHKRWYQKRDKELQKNGYISEKWEVYNRWDSDTYLSSFLDSQELIANIEDTTFQTSSTDGPYHALRKLTQSFSEYRFKRRNLTIPERHELVKMGHQVKRRLFAGKSTLADHTKEKYNWAREER